MSLQATREALAQVLAQAAAIYVDDFSDKDAIIKKSVQELLTPDTSLYIFLSTAFTSAALALVAEHRDDEAKLKEPLYRLLDVSLCCYEAGIQDQSLPFNILEDVLDVLTIEATDILVEYLETRRHRLTMNIDPTKGKGLVLLRMCNEMVRRVSKTRNTLLSGRILMFMANVYPLAERSGVNLRGEFNVKNVTHYEGEDDPIDDDAMEVDGKTDGAEASVYKRLWNLQKYFSNPPLLWQPENLAIFKKGLDLVLKKFEQVNKESILNANKSEEQKIEESAKKRKHELDHESEGVRKKPTNSNGANGVPNGAINGATNPHNERKRRLDSAAEESGPRKKRGNGNTFFPKFLSSPNLFELQLRDPEFRRQILAQSCIILQYISMMSQDEKDRMAKQLVDNPTILNKSVQVPYTLTPEDETWVKETRARIFSACEAMTPGGRQFSKLLLTVITHERNWIEWKNRSCQPFELPPVDITAGVKKPKLPGSETVRRATWLGNDAMTSLWAKGEQVEDILRNPNRKRSIPKFQDAIAMLDEQLDEKGELTGGIEAEYALHTDMRYNWRLYRIALRDNLSLFQGTIPKLGARLEEMQIENKAPGRSLVLEWRKQKARQAETAQGPKETASAEPEPNDDSVAVGEHLDSAPESPKQGPTVPPVITDLPPASFPDSPPYSPPSTAKSEVAPPLSVTEMPPASALSTDEKAPAALQNGEENGLAPANGVSTDEKSPAALQNGEEKARALANGIETEDRPSPEVAGIEGKVSAENTSVKPIDTVANEVATPATPQPSVE